MSNSEEQTSGYWKRFFTYVLFFHSLWIPILLGNEVKLIPWHRLVLAELIVFLGSGFMFAIVCLHRKMEE